MKQPAEEISPQEAEVGDMPETLKRASCIKSPSPLERCGQLP